MNTKFAPALLLALAAALPSFAEEKPAAEAAPAPATCPVSGEELGAMGKPYAYTYKAEGQPDRTVMLCCKMCVAKFNRDPERYLSKTQPAPEQPAPAAKTDEHAGHAH